MTLRVAVVLGTRPEAIKMAPLIRELRRRAGVEVRVVLTAQHRELCDDVLSLFEIAPDVDLDIMRAQQSLADLTARLVTGLDAAFAREQPNLVLVQGDTTTTFVGALAAFYRGIPVGHIEAGLRTGDRHNPFPEELNRRLTSGLADVHFAPTEGARAALVAEGIAGDCIAITGNTVIDALLHVTGQPPPPALLPSNVDPARRLVLVTAHRRENWGRPLDDICAAVATLVERHSDIEIIFPVHPNPTVRDPVHAALGGRERIHLLEPLGYRHFAHLMKAAHVILTDSGGIQEEAPSLGKPVLVLRKATERAEAIDAGTVRLVGTDRATIIAEASKLLDSTDAYQRMARAHNPYGDGDASRRIADILLRRFAV